MLDGPRGKLMMGNDGMVANHRKKQSKGKADQAGAAVSFGAFVFHPTAGQQVYQPSFGSHPLKPQTHLPFRLEKLKQCRELREQHLRLWGLDFHCFLLLGFDHCMEGTIPGNTSP